MEKEEFKIRKGTREDMPQVLALIKELAEFEQMEDQVKIDEAVLEKDGFDSDSHWFSTFVAENAQGGVVGYALYYRAYSTWLGKTIFLEDIYVKPSYRGNNIGKTLLITVGKVARDLGHRLDFHVLSWNSTTEFYKRHGAVNLTNTESWHLYRFDEAALDALIK